MVRIARIAPVGGDDVVIVSASPHPNFTPSRVGRFFVRLLAPRDVYDLIEERSLDARPTVVARADLSVGRYSLISTPRRIDAPSGRP